MVFCIQLARLRRYNISCDNNYVDFFILREYFLLEGGKHGTGSIHGQVTASLTVWPRYIFLCEVYLTILVSMTAPKFSALSLSARHVL